MRRAARGLRLVAAAAVLLGTTACDNIVKYIDVFAVMVDQPAHQTYETEPVPPPEGAVPVKGWSPSFSLAVSDTTSRLRNPLSGTEAEIERGRTLYETYCFVCHGPGGKGRGVAVNYDGEENVANNNRFPFIPALNLTEGTGPTRSDGYIWGMIENGRGMMPSYRRIDDEDRWYIIEYVRDLQRRAGAAPERGAAGPATTAAAASTPDTAAGSGAPGQGGTP